MQAFLTNLQSAEAYHIDRAITETWQDLTEQEESKKEKIKRLAELYKRKITLGLLDIQPHEIARELLKEIQNRKLDISKTTVYRSVPPDCRDPQDEDPRTAFGGVYEDSESHVKLGSIKYEVEKLTKADNAELDTAYQEIVDDEKELQAKLRLIRDKKEKVEEIGQERKLTFSSHQRDKPITSEYGEEKITTAYDAAVDTSAAYEALAEKLKKIPPTDAMLPSITARLKLEAILVHSLADAKYSYSIPEWFLIQKHNIAHGNHAAAKAFSQMTVKGVSRPLTREQVDDTFMDILNIASAVAGRDLDPSVGEDSGQPYQNPTNESILQEAYDNIIRYTAIGALIAPGSWRPELAAPVFADRKVRLSPKLSEKA